MYDKEHNVFRDAGWVNIRHLEGRMAHFFDQEAFLAEQEAARTEQEAVRNTVPE